MRKEASEALFFLICLTHLPLLRCYQRRRAILKWAISGKTLNAVLMNLWGGSWELVAGGGCVMLICFSTMGMISTQASNWHDRSMTGEFPWNQVLMKEPSSYSSMCPMQRGSPVSQASRMVPKSTHHGKQRGLLTRKVLTCMIYSPSCYSIKQLVN